MSEERKNESLVIPQGGTAAKYLVRYRGGYALDFSEGLPRAVSDLEASKFESQEAAALAIANAKLRPAAVEIETVKS